jgi:hypothetical protein
MKFNVGMYSIPVHSRIMLSNGENYQLNYLFRIVLHYFVALH